MTKIYEALEQFDLEQSTMSERSYTVPQLSKCDNEVSAELTETLIGLYRTILNVAPEPGGRIIQFVDSGRGAGFSRIIRAFAKVASSTLKKSVLLLDSDPQSPCEFDFFNPQSRLKWVDDIKKDRSNNSLKRLHGEDLLSVNRLSVDSGLLPVDSEPSQTEEFMQNLKQTFDLTLIDSWSFAVPPKPVLFSPHVDGIVMVVNVGKTRWQIADKQKRELTAQGGNVLGVILNNRTYPIPESVYRRL